MDAVDSFGRWLRRRRRLLDLTQEELAKAVGCALVTIRKMEMDERRPSKALVDRLAKCLNISEAEYSDFMALARNGPISLPSPTEEPVELENRVFVSREQELAHLDTFLKLALAGQGRVVFVTGEAGSGKTALVHEFARRAQDAHSHLIIAGGNCNAYSGIGDPYLPFREILALLTGDLEAHATLGGISQTHARRLVELIPHSIQVLVEAGPDLIDVFIAGKALVARAAGAAAMETDRVAGLKALLARQAVGQGPVLLKQQGLFVQYTQVLQTLARRWPLVLLLDDLQWADTGSLSLLFHLGRQLKGQRILVIGIYRPDDVALGREGGRHPLEPVVNEFRADFGQLQVDLEQANGRQFIEALLDSEPNRLGNEFRHALWRQTSGHALFTVEMLRGLQERSDIVQDEQGHWVEGATLDWDTLPARVEGVIGERLGRLPTALQAALQVASVEGEMFTAEVVAQVQRIDERDLVRRLSGELSKQHRLVREQGSQRLGSRRLSHYRFRHILFQKYLYNNLDPVERSYLHEAVGQILEAWHQDQPEEMAAIAVQLAYHFQAAGLIAKASDYLYQAGHQTVRLSASQEAIAHFTTALALLATLPQTPERDQQELRLQLELGAQLATTSGYAAPEVEAAFARARELAQYMEKTPELFPALFGLWRFYLTGAKHQTGRELAEQCLALAEYLQEPALLLQAYHALSFSLCCLGELVPARHYLEQGIALYNPEQYHALAFSYGTDPGVHSLSLLTFQLWLLGYSDQALAKSNQALTLARELAHPMSQAVSLTYAAWLYQFRQESAAVHALTEAAIALCTKHGIMLYLMVATILRGWALAENEQAEEGITQIRQGLTGFLATGAYIFRPYFLILLAEAYEKRGQAVEGLMALEEALAMADRGEERLYEAWVYQLKGELLLQAETQAEAKAETCFHQAIAIAQQQGAKLLELRATMSLASLWQKQGRVAEAQQRLTEIYQWFTEGFDTMDLQQARLLLEELQS
jgi:predicted ATPase/DNA-binding XRE family transcriptional regulator